MPIEFLRLLPYRLLGCDLPLESFLNYYHLALIDMTLMQLVSLSALRYHIQRFYLREDVAMEGSLPVTVTYFNHLAQLSRCQL